MKVKGNVNLLKQNMNYYIRVSNEGKDLKVSKLYNSFYNDFLAEDAIRTNKLILENLEIENDELEIKNNLENKEDNNLEIENNDLEIKNVVESESKDECDDNISPSLFMSMVSSLKESSTTVVEDKDNEIIHGIFIDEWTPVELEEYKGVPFREEKPEFNVEDESVNSIIHGIFIDEWVKDEDTENELNSDEDTEKELNSDEDTEETIKYTDPIVSDDLDSLLDSILESISSHDDKKDKDDLNETDWSIVDENKNDTKNISEDSLDKRIRHKDSLHSGNFDKNNFGREDLSRGDRDFNRGNLDREDLDREDLNKKEFNKEEVVVVPTNIRDFIKSHQGSEISFVLKYYSKKELDKALGLGKIYKKQGRLYV